MIDNVEARPPLESYLGADVPFKLAKYRVPYKLTDQGWGHAKQRDLPTTGLGARDALDDHEVVAAGKNIEAFLNDM